MLTYNTFVSSLANFLVVPLTDQNFVDALPRIIDDSEQRLYRELDLLVTRDFTEALVMSPGIFAYGIPVSAGGHGPFVVIETISVITPAGTTSSNGALNQLDPISREAMFSLYPSNSGAGVPKFFAMTSQNVFVVGPRPDAAYTVAVSGTIRPMPLSQSNQTTFLSQYLPDVFFAAALVMSAGYQLNFSPGADNPAAGMSWETHVQTLLASAKIEEFRKKFGSQGWTSKEPDPIATPPRT